MLIGDRPDLLEPAADTLTAAGHQCLTFGLPVTDADEQQLAADLRAAARDDAGLRILHLGALGPEAPPMQSLLRMHHRVLGATQRLFRAAADADLRKALWVVTRGGQHVTDSDSVAPEQSSLWGFCRSAALEYPQVWGGLVDLSGAGDDDWSRLVDVIATTGSGEDQIAVRQSSVYLPRLVRKVPTAHPEGLQLRSDATYLVTGGRGGLGLEIAGELAARGAGHLVLTSRRAPDATAEARIQAIREDHGCDVRVVAADVADPHEVARLSTMMQAELPHWPVSCMPPARTAPPR